MSTSVRLLPLLLLALSACRPPEEQEQPDAGAQEIPDSCNSAEEARTLAECELVLGQELRRHISVAGDRDWYSVRLPATMGPRSLVRVTAGYVATSTAVNLAVSLLEEDGLRSVTERQVDEHGQGQPRPVTLIVPYGTPNARLLVMLADGTGRAVDLRNPYSLTVEVVENPDANEPNDMADTATPVALADEGGVGVGRASGYLATRGDVDRFSFDVALGKIAYVRLTAPSLAPQPAAYKLSYKLLRPDGTAEDEGQALNNYLAADLSTARRVASAGTWQVLVQGWRGSTTEVPPGDLRLRYELEVRVLDEADPSELSSNNDERLQAPRLSLAAPGGPMVSFTGRLGSVPDLDWYAVDLAAHTARTVLHYRVVPLSSGGRFPPLAGLANRQVRVLAELPGATAADCTGRAELCPQGYGADSSARELVRYWCQKETATPLCLHSSREELEVFSNLRNLEGTVPVPAHGSNLSYYFLVEDGSADWADDKDYRLEVRWSSDADEASHDSGGVEQPRAASLNEDSSSSSFPAPPAGTGYEVQGTLSHGMGRLVRHNPLVGQGVRGPADYDAVPTDVDTYVYQLPPGLSEPLDRTWMLQWEVEHLPDGGVPHGLALDLTFCDGDQTDGGACTPVSTGSRGAPLTLAYRDDALRAWHSPSAYSGLQPHYSLERGATSTTVTVLPYACACLEPRFVRGGTVKVAVSAVDRTDYGTTPYRLRTAYTDYPKAYAVDGGTATCPAPTASVGEDGGTVYAPGCLFTRQP